MDELALLAVNHFLTWSASLAVGGACVQKWPSGWVKNLSYRFGLMAHDDDPA